MGIWDKVKEEALNQFIEVIEWLDESEGNDFVQVSGSWSGDQEWRATDRA